MKNTTKKVSHAPVSHIIIQAGGRGSRLGHLTDNKPKALVSVMGEPLILNQLSKYPKATYYIIMDYQRDVFKKYMNLFTQTKYSTITPNGKHTCAGIKTALKKIPDNTPFMIVWCDLYFSGEILPKNLSPQKYNYIGLSKTFPCRWSFQRGKFAEEKSNTHGIAGVFVFKNKKEIRDIPEEGELCKYLQGKDITFRPFFLKKTYEVGTTEAYDSVVKNFYHTRPFNALAIKDDKVIKIPKNAQGKMLAKREAHWYKTLSPHNQKFIPLIYKSRPLTMQKINGKSLHHYELTDNQKEKVLTALVTNLTELHTLFPKKKSSRNNDYEAILGKTKKRLDSIHTLIPDINNPYIIVNGKKCINFYKKWHVVENMLDPFLGNDYMFIHGDPTFSNTLYEEATAQPYFIDPRGYYGKSLLYGDEDYDWAKVYYSLVGNYDQFNNKKFRLSLNADNNTIKIQSNKWEHLGEKFFKLIKRDKAKIEAYHAILWLSLTSYAWDDYDSICGAFYNGTYLMQLVHEKTL